MNIDFLKGHLSDDLFTQAQTALSSVEGLEIIQTNDGSWLPKSKFDEEVNKHKATKTQLATITRQLEEAKKAGEGVASLQATIDSLTAQVQERDATITGMKRSAKVQAALAKANARDPKVVERLLDASKIGEDDKGNLTGLDEQVKALKESSGYLFAEDPGSRGGWGGGKNPEEQRGHETGNNEAMNNALRAMLGIVQA